MPDEARQLPTELHFLTIAEAAGLIARRQLSPVELTRALIARAEQIDPQLNAYLLLTAEMALDQAAAAEADIMAGRHRGPMHGIPVALKDIYCTKGVPTTGHSKTRAGFLPTEDAATVTKLYESGAVLLGKLATHEFAHGGPSFDLPWPPARNPWNRDHITGGSSSGSGAAVAAGLVPGALGTDTGGSIRSPAALCGIVGLKPTYGLVSRRGIYPNSFTFDHAGPMTWTVEDCAIMLSAISGHDPADPGSARAPQVDYRAALTGDIKGVRIGVITNFHEEDVKVTPETAAALDAALDVLRALGASVEPIRLRPAQHYSDVKITIAESELFAVHEANLRARPGDFGEDFLGRALGAVLISGADYVQAQRERRVMLAEMKPVYAGYDVLVTATAPGPAARLGDWRTVQFWQKTSLTTPFNVTGGPALAQCMGFSSTGLPLSLQIAGRPFDDATVLRVAHAYEAATSWRDRRPQIDPSAAFATILPPAPDPMPEADPAMRGMVARMCRDAGLDLSERQLDMVCVAAPYVFAMTRRLRRERGFSDEPANVFRFFER